MIPPPLLLHTTIATTIVKLLILPFIYRAIEIEANANWFHSHLPLKSMSRLCVFISVFAELSMLNKYRSIC